MDSTISGENAGYVKSCCARLYESDFIRLLLGNSFHPGGLQLTSRLGTLLNLASGSRVLDVASGKGASALHLATTFGCEVTGVDYSRENVRQANDTATAMGIGSRVLFKEGDAERLPFADASFDAIICECAFCTFPSKSLAAAEFARVLKRGGRVGISDITRSVKVPPELDTLMSWIARIADAQPIQGYTGLLSEAGFNVDCIEPHDEVLTEMVHQIRKRLLFLEIAAGLNKFELPSNVDFAAVKQVATGALRAIEQRQLGYAIIAAGKTREKGRDYR
ncbi:methyltransferase domain-containing protein [bacterium]|nr:methyltransferase domain-containing protein [bacterium]